MNESIQYNNESIQYMMYCAIYNKKKQKNLHHNIYLKLLCNYFIQFCDAILYHNIAICNIVPQYCTMLQLMRDARMNH